MKEKTFERITGEKQFIYQGKGTIEDPLYIQGASKQQALKKAKRFAEYGDPVVLQVEKGIVVSIHKGNVSLVYSKINQFPCRANEFALHGLRGKQLSIEEELAMHNYQDLEIERLQQAGYGTVVNSALIEVAHPILGPAHALRTSLEINRGQEVACVLNDGERIILCYAAANGHGKLPSFRLSHFNGVKRSIFGPTKINRLLGGEVYTNVQTKKPPIRQEFEAIKFVLGLHRETYSTPCVIPRVTSLDGSSDRYKNIDYPLYLGRAEQEKLALDMFGVDGMIEQSLKSDLFYDAIDADTFLRALLPALYQKSPMRVLLSRGVLVDVYPEAELVLVKEGRIFQDAPIRRLIVDDLKFSLPE